LRVIALVPQPAPAPTRAHKKTVSAKKKRR
jgi:hypothetical protein